MFAKLIPSLCVLCGLACASGGQRNALTEGGVLDQVIVPQGVSVSARPGTNGVFSVTALTLQAAPGGAQLYAAVSNDGEIPACNPSFSIELRNGQQETVAAGISGLNVRDFYRLSDGSGTVAGCVPPGQRSMVAITSLALDGRIEDVTDIVYASSYWFLEAVRIEGARVTDVRTVPDPGGLAYTGLLVNDFEFALERPTVAIFPTNGVGRPLAVAYAASTQELLPGGSWMFETNAASYAGTGYAAYPMGGP